MQFFNKSFDPITTTQYLVIAGLVSIAVSPPLANLFIALSFIATLSISTLRNQLLDFFKTKLGYACIAFILVLLSGFIYGIETNKVIASSIWGWRKFLMLPIAAAVFMNAPEAKQKLINSFWFACLILMIYSFFAYLNLPILVKPGNGVVARNYVTQGIFFSVAAIIALANSLNADLPKWQRIINGISIPIFIFNIALIAVGRSGYIALIIMTAAYSFFYLNKISITKKICISIGASLLISAFLLNMQSPRDRIELAKQEYLSGQKNEENTSIGLRLTFWKNTIQMIPDYAFKGTGTGGFEKAYTAYISQKDTSNSMTTGDPHNQYLKILIEHGITGLIIFLTLLIFLIRQRASNPFKDIGIASLLAIAATSLFNSHFSTFNEGQFIWILSGALFATEKP